LIAKALRRSRFAKLGGPDIRELQGVWCERDYQTIVDVGSTVPDDLLQQDPVVLRWYDQAQIRLQE